LKSLDDYRALVSEVERLCARVRANYADHIACRKGCSGNCCRIHLGLWAIEAASVAGALGGLAVETARRIRDRAARATTFGPCPLLEEGACLLYPSRLIICRTHGFPMATVYRGRRSVGFCPENFRRLEPLPEDAVIDLDPINRALSELNRRFLEELPPKKAMRPRYLMSEALLIEL
jgi:Fe-S-cluster containining protein